VGEFSSILAAQLGFLPSLDDLVRSCQHIRWNRQPDLFSRFQIEHQFELRGLFYGQIGKDFVDFSLLSLRRRR
jgi:hypothetical protein